MDYTSKNALTEVNCMLEYPITSALSLSLSLSLSL